MALLLHIDTALESSSICLSNNDEILSSTIIPSQNQSASIHVAIKEIIEREGYSIANLSAISVSNGPGSYTGLRVGLSTAKGLCYSLKIPLIVINTLEIMANAVKNEATDLICPMIDARRMEVFAAIYTKEMQVFEEPQALILEEGIFDALLNEQNILFTGTGSNKFKQITKHLNAKFVKYKNTVCNQVGLAYNKYQAKHFADLAYVEPHYLKQVYINIDKGR